MAHFDTDYQRLEASYSDSPPGEEDLLMHVPEGSKCMIYIHKSKPQKPTFILPNYCLLCNEFFAAQWHHIENLDLFFQRISFFTQVWYEQLLCHALLTLSCIHKPP